MAMKSLGERDRQLCKFPTDAGGAHRADQTQFGFGEGTGRYVPLRSGFRCLLTASQKRHAAIIISASEWRLQRSSSAAGLSLPAFSVEGC